MSFLRHEEIYREARRGLANQGRRIHSADAPTHALDEFPAGYSLAGRLTSGVHLAERVTQCSTGMVNG